MPASPPDSPSGHLPCLGLCFVPPLHLPPLSSTAVDPSSAGEAARLPEGSGGVEQGGRARQSCSGSCLLGWGAHTHTRPPVHAHLYLCTCTSMLVLSQLHPHICTSTPAPLCTGHRVDTADHWDRLVPVPCPSHVSPHTPLCQPCIYCYTCLTARK